MWRCIFLLVFTQNLLAQPYGQYKYAHSGVFMTDAFKTSINSKGHILIGYKPSSAAGTYNFSIDKTNPAGGFSSAAFSFKKEYQFFNTTACGAGNANQILNCSGVSAIETNVAGSPKAWYAVTGTYDEGCFFATLDSLGNPISAKAYMFPYINPFSNVKTYITESIISPGNYYLSGQHDSTIYVLKVNALGNIIWSSYYSVGTSYVSTSDIMECPFTGNLLVIGSSNAPSPFITLGTNGFILSLDRNNGNINFYKAYTVPAQNCQLFSLAKPAFSTTGGQGYIISGSSQGYPALPWMIKIGTAGNIIWSTVIMPSTDNGAYIMQDVIERPIGSTHEYYGLIKSVAAGMIVVKLNDYGIPVQTVNNEFVFNTTATVVSLAGNLDFENSVPNIALSTYGTVDGANGGELYMVRSYFNGKSGCNETNTIVSNYYAGPDTVVNLWSNKFGSLVVCNKFALVDIPATTTQNILCNNLIVSGGSNSGVTIVKDLSEEDPEVSMFPNPTESSTNLKFKLNSRSKVEIIVCNELGQDLKTVLDSELDNGVYDAEINFANFKFRQGLYFIRFIINGESKTYKVIYNK